MAYQRGDEDAEPDRGPRRVDGSVTGVFDFAAISLDENGEVNCESRSRNKPCNRRLVCSETQKLSNR